jgi:DNA-binding transcriptional LysR family regulator
VPVAAPSYIERVGMGSLADVARATLLHEETREDWTEWLLAAGLDPLPARHGIVFDDENAVIQAALAGQGVALGSRDILAADLAAARLHILFSLPVHEGHGYYLVFAPGALVTPRISKFRTFVRAEMKRASLELPRARHMADRRS